MAETCRNCAADVARCNACGFWIPATLEVELAAIKAAAALKGYTWDGVRLTLAVPVVNRAP